MKNNPKKTVSRLMIWSVIILIVIIALLVYNGIKNKTDVGETETVIDKSTGEVVEPELLKIYNMEEIERIKYYFNQYVKLLEAENYENAYAMLDNKFKNNYFKTLEDYTKYIQQKSTSLTSIDYDGINRFGNYYILDVSFVDIFSVTNETEENKTSQKYIIYETNYNEYTLSFQVQ